MKPSPLREAAAARCKISMINIKSARKQKTVILEMFRNTMFLFYSNTFSNVFMSL